MTLNSEPIDDGEVDDDRYEPVYLKYCFEGAESLPRLAGALRDLAAHLDRRAVEGWRLDQPVDGGWAHMTRD